MKNKVFCIGFHKTGTTSIKEALQILGYSVTGPNGVHDQNIAQNAFAMACELVEGYDAFQDNPWPILYRELDEKFPNSKFILTHRTSDSWIKSQVRHFGNKVTPMREWIYGVGCPKGNEEIYLERYKKHNKEVIEYFKNRPSDFLIMDLPSGDGWVKLCDFLSTAVPDRPFPHEKKAVS